MKYRLFIYIIIVILTFSGCSKNAATQFEIPKFTEEEIREYNEAVESINKQRTEFLQILMNAFNAPGLPIMCEKIYFSSDNDLIIEVNGEWLLLDEALKNDMIYALKEALRQNKIFVNSSGYGQFFSTSGRPLEAFYAD